ncbi:MAG TPA: hypothetical protein VJ972_07530 [Anaerolineales bacterium]|nr:hypothetical protein [Anaerolineales bacterium]
MIGLAKGGFGGFGALFSSKKYSDVFYPKYEAAIVMFFFNTLYKCHITLDLLQSRDCRHHVLLDKEQYQQNLKVFRCQPHQKEKLLYLMKM